MRALSAFAARGRQILFDLLALEGVNIERGQDLKEEGSGETPPGDLVKQDRSLDRFSTQLLQPARQVGEVDTLLSHLGFDVAAERLAPSVFSDFFHDRRHSSSLVTSSYMMTKGLATIRARRHDVITGDDAISDDEMSEDGAKARRRRRGKQSFLLKPQARTLGILDIAGLTDEQAHQKLCDYRWPENEGNAICPECGCCDCYSINTNRLSGGVIKTQKRFKCSACAKVFSVTSGTIFASRKLTYKQLLVAIFFFAQGAKGMPALELARTLNINPKSAFVLLHKIREAIESARSDVMLEGIVEIDGCYYGGHRRPPNAGRDGRHSLPDPTPEEKSKKKVVIAMVERNGAAVPVVAQSETQAAAFAAALKHIRPGSVVAADEAPAYEPLHSRYEMLRINHRQTFAEGPACTNQAESFHSRMRRAEIGQYHHMSGRYLIRYAHEMAYRHSRRQIDNGAIYKEMAELGLSHPISRDWKGYWRRRAAA